MKQPAYNLVLAASIIIACSALSIADVDIDDLVATGHDCRIDLRWSPVWTSDIDGFNIYRSRYIAGNYTKINSDVHTASVYSDYLGNNDRPYCYYVVPVVGGIEGAASSKVSATPYDMTDEELLTSVQEACFRYCWDFAHPDSGMVRERYASYDRQTVTTGGSGFGLMNIIVGAERGFITRSQGAERTLQILTFLQESAVRYHGAWSHWMDGTTGESIPFNYTDQGEAIIGADIVETAFMAEGILAVRQYFDSTTDSVEIEIRSRATQLYEEIEWDWYTRTDDTDGSHLYWLWSPDYGWQEGFAFEGCETIIAYILAIASPTHPIDSSCYYDGFGGGGNYQNGDRYYGITQWVSPYNTPMFWTHYSFLGFDPRNKHDNYCNYFDNSRNIALVDQAYCIDNPNGYAGYSNLVWGLTASSSPTTSGYLAHAPGSNDNGTIAPTAALSSMPYTPSESLATLKEFYYTYGSNIWGPFGFYDAFNLDQSWYSDAYLAIDQATIAPMIENYRTGLCWDLFMANSEITNALKDIGWALREDNGLRYEYYEGTWTSLPDFDLLTPAATGNANNFDLGLRQRDDSFAFRFSGYIDIPKNGGYTFYLNSDDGSKLFINGNLVVNNDGQHSAQETSGYVYLLKGMQEITVTYFEYDGNQKLTLSYSSLYINKKQVPVDILFRCNRQGDYNNDCSVNIEDLRIIAADWLDTYSITDFINLSSNWYIE